jgi:hypothetical protein
MTPSNFNWFLHAMLFYHTRYVIQKQNERNEKTSDIEEEDEQDDEQDRGDNIE